MNYENLKKIESLPKTIKLNAYNETIEFNLTDKREFRFFGRTKDCNQRLERTETLKDNEVFYESEFGWGVNVDLNKMETVSYDGTN